MSGQPCKSQSDVNKFRNEYIESLNLQANINDMNLQANKTYLLTGQLPPQSQLQDTRTNAEKLHDVEKIKINIAESLKPIAESQFAYQIVSKIMDSPLNLNNSLLRFLAQRASSIAEQIKKVMPYGIAGDINDLERIVEFIKNMYSEQQKNFQSTKSYLNTIGSQNQNSRVLSGNDIDNIIMGLQDILKNISILNERGVNIANVNVIGQNLSIILSRLKESLPTTDQVRLMMDDIENPQFNNPYDDGNNLQIVDFSRAGISSFYKLIEKLPKYSEVMALISKIQQYIISANYNLVQDGMNKLQRLFMGVEGINDDTILQQFRDIKQRQMVKQGQYAKLNAEQTRKFISEQSEEQKDLSKAQKVYIINPENNPVWTRNTNIQQVAGNQGVGGLNSGDGGFNTGFNVGLGGFNFGLGANIGIPFFGQNQGSPQASASFGVNSGSSNQVPSPPSLMQEQIEIPTKYNPPQSKSVPETKPKSSGPSSSSSLADEVRKGRIKQLLKRTDPNDFIEIARRFGQDPSISLNRLVDIIANSDYKAGDYGLPSGMGLKRRGRPRGSGLPKVEIPKIPNFVGFGINEVNQKQLDKGIFKLRRGTRSNYVDMPSRRISNNLKTIIKTIVGGGVPQYEELGKLDNEEKDYLHKIISRSNMNDRLSIPAPSKDQQEKDIHNFEIMKGQIMSGNDSIELVKKFKLLVRKLSKQGLLPKADVEDMLDTLLDLGY